MNGNLILPGTFGRRYRVFGGSYYLKPPRVVGVKMAAEIKNPCDIDIPTPDFNVPPADVIAYGLDKAITAVLNGKPVYVGCMAGRGRTGLFLALLAKAWGIKNPVEYVRKNYYSHAVENELQYNYVKTYKVPFGLKAKIFFARVFDLSPRKELTTLSEYLMTLTKKESGISY